MDCAVWLRNCVGSEYEHGLDVAIYDTMRNCAFSIETNRSDYGSADTIRKECCNVG